MANFNLEVDAVVGLTSLILDQDPVTARDEDPYRNLCQICPVNAKRMAGRCSTLMFNPQMQVLIAQMPNKDIAMCKIAGDPNNTVNITDIFSDIANVVETRRKVVAMLENAKEIFFT